ncbi:MAG: hypothetical protein WKG07_22255 [Hymenobacter sp.]
MNIIVILGAAESGVGAALLAQAKGHAVFVSDRGAIQASYKREADRRPASSSRKTSTRLTRILASRRGN